MARMGAPHPGQRDRGRTTEAPSGRRTMQTFRNDPQMAPKAKAPA
jgi:hypothetical protein